MPLLPRQRRWLNIDRIYPGAASPQVNLTLRLRGPLVVHAWERAVSAVVDRHETLRARFVSGDGGDVQVFEPPRGLELEHIDLGELPSGEREERARELLVERRGFRFDLESGPPVISGLIRLADDDHVWTLTIHHISADGQSLAIITKELGLLYRAYATGTDPELPELAVRAGDYALWHAANQDDDERHRRFWVQLLTGTPNLELRTDRARPAAKGAPAAFEHLTFGGDLATRVDHLAAATGSTRFLLTLTALQLVLGRWSEQPDFCVGITVSGSERYRSDLADIVAPFNTVLALRCDLSDDPTFAELADRNRVMVLDALMHQDFLYSKVIAALELPHDPGRAQLCQVLFGFDESAGDALTLPDVSVEGFSMPIPTMPYDLLIYAGVDRDGMWARFNYDTALFTAETVIGWMREMERILHAATAGQATRLGDPTT